MAINKDESTLANVESSRFRLIVESSRPRLDVETTRSELKFGMSQLFGFVTFFIVTNKKILQLVEFQFHFFWNEFQFFFNYLKYLFKIRQF